MSRRWLAGWVSMLLGVVLVLPAQAQSEDRVSIFVDGSAGALANVRAQHGPGLELSKGLVLTVNRAALAQLQGRRDLLVEINPERRVQGRFERISGKPSGARVVPTDQTPWGMAVTYNAPDLTSTSGGSGVIVAILDTGVADHRDLPKPTVCLDASGAVVRSGCKDGHGHGTHVTGTILANSGTDQKGVYGVAPGASYQSYKVCGNGGFCSSGGIAWSIEEATRRGAHIISMSLGGSVLSTPERNAIDYATDRGVLVIAAAGNSGPGLDTINYPGAYQRVVAVAALEQVSGGTVDPANLRVTDFSSRGINDGDGAIEEREVEVAAPGQAVESTFNNGGYAIWSGTSMATPHVSGLAAKQWQGNGPATRALLQSKAQAYDITQAVGGGTSAGDDPASGLGNPRIN